MDKGHFFKIYSAAHNNAVALYNEALLLYNHGHHSRSYALAFTALEEISKSQFAADVYTGLKQAEDFLHFFRNHRNKVDQIKWAHIDANSFLYNLKWIGPDRDDVEEINPEEPVFQKRQHALYVDVDNGNILEPKEIITEQNAKEILHIVEVALHRIWEMTEYWGHNIGTKGFMK